MPIEIERGIKPRAQKILIYGQHGIGKTTLAAQFPGAVFIDTEDGTAGYDVARLPIPQTWNELLEEVAWAARSGEVGTLVIDSMDWAERLCINALCIEKDKASIEDFGYGKGYVYLKDTFKRLLNGMDYCISHGVNVVCTAHDQVTRIEQPEEMASYSVYGLKLSKYIAPLLKEWADAVLYCHYKTVVVTDNSGKGHATGGTLRVIQCNHNAVIDAKNRWGMPDEIPMSYEEIAKYFNSEEKASE